MRAGRAQAATLAWTALLVRSRVGRVALLRVRRRCRAAATRKAPAGEKLMSKPAVHRRRLGRAALAAASLLALAGALPAAEYKMTVNRDRLINAQNEPQNWLHDERRLRLDALLEAHADQPRQRQEPAHGLGAGARRHAGRRAERPGERGQSAHRQRLHVHDRRLGHDLQDRRAQPEQGRVRLDLPIPACSTRATCRARAASRCGKTW